MSFFRNYRLFLFGFVCLLATQAQAQFATKLELNKENFLTYEGLEATVTIINRSGSDLVMGGPNGLPWLSFDITEPSGQQSPPMRLRVEDGIIFKAGSTISRKIVLSNYYAFSQYGDYFLAASVYHPPSQQYYSSNRVRAAYTDVNPFWQQTFGVPTGLPGAGQIRKYTLSQMRSTQRIDLYVRLLEDKTGLKLATFSLGSCIWVSDPQVAVDRDNKMHVLFMAVPHIYAHCVVDTQGQLVRRRYFKEEKTDRPALVVQTDSSIDVSGGIPYDPNAAPATKPTGKSIGQRPPGL